MKRRLIITCLPSIPPRHGLSPCSSGSGYKAFGFNYKGQASTTYGLPNQRPILKATLLNPRLVSSMVSESHGSPNTKRTHSAFTYNRLRRSPKSKPASVTTSGSLKIKSTVDSTSRKTKKYGVPSSPTPKGAEFRRLGSVTSIIRSIKRNLGCLQTSQAVIHCHLDHIPRPRSQRRPKSHS